MKFLFILLGILQLVFSLNNIRDLEPKYFWNQFYDLSQYPRCPTKEKNIREEYIQKFALKYGFNYKVDDYGNCLIEVPPTRGYENKPKIVIQSHLDMVCEKNRNSNHNFDKDPLKLIYSPDHQDWIKANETTLGADAGFGVAASLGVSIDPSIVHGPLELLFTVEEEIGLVGALKLKPGFVTGTILLNLDVGLEGTLIVGCAGGIRFESRFKEEIIPRKEGTITFELQIKGLSGGHSGLDINKGKGNAIKLTSRLLKKVLNNVEVDISSFNSGTATNAIPRESHIILQMNPSKVEDVKKIIQEFIQEIKLEFGSREPGFFITLERFNQQIHYIYHPKFMIKMIDFIQASPSGVLEMSQEIPNLVQTSLNLAMIEVKNREVFVTWSIRSSVDSSKYNVVETLKSLTNLANGSFNLLQDYNGWRPNLQSPIIELCKKVYRETFGVEVKIDAMHAGLEPGVLGNIYPRLAQNMISLGPNYENPHSPIERMQISSVSKFYVYLNRILLEYTK